MTTTEKKLRKELVEHNVKVLTTHPWEDIAWHLVPVPRIETPERLEGK